MIKINAVVSGITMSMRGIAISANDPIAAPLAIPNRIIAGITKTKYVKSISCKTIIILKTILIFFQVYYNYA